MIIVLKPHATREHAEELMGRIAALGLRPLYMPGQERAVLGALGDERALESLHLDSDPLVESVTPILAPHNLGGRGRAPPRPAPRWERASSRCSRRTSWWGARSIPTTPSWSWAAPRWAEGA